MSLSVISLNCEGDRYLDRIQHFLQDADADVVCLQEIFMSDAEHLGRTLGCQVTACPQDIFVRASGQPDVRGIAILSKQTPNQGGFFYYHLAGDVLPTFDAADRAHCYQHVSHRSVVWVEVKDESGQPARFATIHHTVTPNGVENEIQIDHTNKLLGLLATMPPMVLLGDFNIPRGYNANYDRFLAAGYRDAIPEHYTCSLDPLHRAWDKVPEIQKYMVDYIWLPAGYEARGVALVPNLSDHRAITADLFLE